MDVGKDRADTSEKANNYTDMDDFIYFHMVSCNIVRMVDVYIYIYIFGVDVEYQFT